MSSWNEQKAARRFELIEKLHDVNQRTSESEVAELDSLTEELREYLKPMYSDGEHLLTSLEQDGIADAKGLSGGAIEVGGENEGEDTPKAFAERLDRICKAGDAMIVRHISSVMTEILSMVSAKPEGPGIHLMLLSRTLAAHSLAVLELALGNDERSRLAHKDSLPQWLETAKASLWRTIEETDDEAYAESLRKLGVKLFGDM